MRITDLPIWRELRPAARVKPHGTGWVINISPKDLPPDLFKRAVETKTECCSCGNPMNPFRFQGSLGYGTFDWTRKAAFMYVAVACSLHDSVQCSRTSNAHAAMDELREDLWKLEQSQAA